MNTDALLSIKFLDHHLSYLFYKINILFQKKKELKKIQSKGATKVYGVKKKYV